MRSPEELREDKSVFMNQGEWELLHILSKYKSFSVDNDDYYAEMKFHVCFLYIYESVENVKNIKHAHTHTFRAGPDQNAA